jgi:hypothetical protein
VLDSAASTVSAFALDGAGRPTLIGTALPTDPNGVVSSACAADGTLPGPCPTAAATASSDADGRVARYDWDFGDGQRAMDAGPMPTQTYATPGAYQATVTVADDEGCSNAWIFTGQTALCNGSQRATASQRVVVLPNATAGAR